VDELEAGDTIFSSSASKQVNSKGVKLPRLMNNKSLNNEQDTMQTTIE
jgi:hypothetical protein